MHIIQFNCDKAKDHKSDIGTHIDSSSESFEDLDDAVTFLNECTNPITSIEELVRTKKLLSKADIKYEEYKQRVKEREKIG